mmetsp:Transcript_51155/g.95874  ORF Transcript_51155/g.95874 Transcript_51155/m.95874 type:complete len:240 (-) Transcript_51155:12-731(-)
MDPRPCKRLLLVQVGRCLEILIPDKSIEQSWAPQTNDADRPCTNEKACNCPEGAHELVLRQAPHTGQAHGCRNHEASNAVVRAGIRKQRVAVRREDIMDADDFSGHPVIEPRNSEENAAEANDHLPHSHRCVVHDHVDLGQKACSNSPKNSLGTHGHLHHSVHRSSHLKPLEGKGACDEREGDDQRDACPHIAPVGHEDHESRWDRRFEIIRVHGHPYLLSRRWHRTGRGHWKKLEPAP